MFTLYDKVLIFFLLFLSLVSFLVVIFIGNRVANSREAVVFLQGREVNRVSLYQNRKFRVDGCLIEVDDGKIRVVSSTCPNKICVSTGWINNPLQVIVCAPQKVVVKIEGKSPANQVDVVSK